MMDALKTKIHDWTRGRSEEFDSEDLKLLAQVRLGVEVTQRLGPVLSEYLETQAQEARLRALEKLEKISPTDSAAISILQVEAQSARNALQWLSNAVQRGELAEVELRQRDEDEQTNG